MSFKKGNLYTNEAKTEGIYPNTVYSAIYKDDMSKTLDADLGDLSHYNAQTITSGVDPLYLHLDMDLLWTNASPTSSFSEQTISIDLTNYNAIIVEFGSSITSTSDVINIFCLKGQSIVYVYVDWNTYDSAYFRKRTILASNSGVSVSSEQNDNAYFIPTKIYGIR